MIESIELKSVNNFNKDKHANNYSVTNPYSEAEERAGALADSPTTFIDVTGSRKNTKDDAKKIANLMANQSNEQLFVFASQPQLKAPTVEINEEQTTALAQYLTVAQENPNAGIAELTKKAAEAQEHWKEYELDLSDFNAALNRLDTAAANLDKLLKKENPPASQKDIDRATKEVQDARTSLTAIMSKLDNSIQALPSYGDAGQMASFNEANSAMTKYDRIMLELQTTMMDVRVSSLGYNNKIEKEVRSSLLSSMKVKAAEYDANQAWRNTLTEVLKWAGFALTAVATIFSGGALSAAFGLITTTLMLLDMTVLDGKISKAVMEPIMAVMTPVIADFVTKINGALIAAGCSPSLATTISVIVVALTIAAVVAVAGKLGAAIGDKIMATEFGAAVTELLDKVAEKLISLIPNFVKNFFNGPTLLNELFGLITKKLGAALDVIENTTGNVDGIKYVLTKALHTTFETFRDMTPEQHLILLEGFAAGVRITGTFGTASVTGVKGTAEEQKSIIEGSMEKTKFENESVAQSISQFSEESSGKIPDIYRLLKIISTNLESLRQTNTEIANNLHA